MNPNPPPKEIRAFLFDVDKTLTNFQGEVTPFTRQVIARLERKGYLLGVCTGRGFARVCGHILPLFSPKSLHIVSGGSQVVTATGEQLFSRPLSVDQVHRLIQAAEKFGVEFLFDSGRVTYGSTKFVQENQLEPYQQHDGVISNFVVYFLTPEFREWMSKQTEFQVIEHESTWLDTQLFDITALGVSKETGVNEWMKIHGLTRQEVAGFGDSYNDLTFLTAVGWGVAMGNALAEVKDRAQQVIGSADEDGLARYLEEKWL